MNIIVSEKKDKHTDYIAIAKQIWDIFSNKYDHIEIQRPIKIKKNGSIYYEGSMIQLDVIFVDYTDNKLLDDKTRIKLESIAEKK